eukprot:CAMPEP_0181519754 /NCGR_PEP_ID=MMETSP1110-20121109/65952_1 /TAXON_ID=174948 /ORGANISM="Symbiodinium sp., Strain CCMP421" /LENGTH=38 /DNA_ID= /DNA_START= /DNA_END= /DNA_ORIENTATION=
MAKCVVQENSREFGIGSGEKGKNAQMHMIVMQAEIASV